MTLSFYAVWKHDIDLFPFFFFPYSSSFFIIIFFYTYIKLYIPLCEAVVGDMACSKPLVKRSCPVEKVKMVWFERV